MLASFAHAENSQFRFDASGNLLTQSPELIAPPQITGQPQDQLVGAGDTASFLVVATGTEPLTYQWRFNGADFGGATSDTLFLQNVDAANEGDFRVVVSNASGSVTSAPAFLYMDVDHDGMSDTWEFVYFGNLNRSASGDFDGDGVSNLREFLDGTSPANSNSVVFKLLVVSDLGTVIKTPDQSSYTPGQIVTVTAVPPTNGAFHAWLGDVITRTNPLTLVMTNDKTVYAHFTPIVFTWTNLASGDWNVATNWTPNLVPGSNDTAIIATPSTVTLDTPADCWDLTLGNGVTIPTLTGTGTLKVRGNFVWSSGTMSGSGRTIIEPGGTLEINAPSSQTPMLFNGRTLENGGTFFWTGAGNLVVAINAVITNRAGALISVQNAATFSIGGYVGTIGGRIDNAGTFRKSASASTTTIENPISFNNSGTVEIQTGTLSLAGGGTSSGSFDVPGGTALRFTGGTHTAGGSSSISGAGQLSVSSGIVTLAGLVNVSGSNTFSGGAANFTGNTLCTNNTLTISGGTANYSGTGLVSPSVVNLSGGALDGTSTVTANSTMNWTGGNMTGTGRSVIPTGATLNLSNPGAVQMFFRTLDNGGTISWTAAGNLVLANSAVITNRAGGLISIQNATAFGNGGFGSGGRIDNAGTFRKSANVGTTTVESLLSFNNSGTVEIQTGTLSLAGGGTSSGSFDVPGGTALRFSGGTHTAGASSSITGTGQLSVSAGIVNLAGSVNVSGSNTFSGGTANFTGNTLCTNNTLTISGGTANYSGTGLVSPSVVNLSGGALDGTSTVTANSLMNWTGGNMTGTGRTVIPTGVTLNLSNPGAVQMFFRTLENGGTVSWTGAGNLVLVNNAVLTNRTGALISVQNAAAFSFGGFGIGGRIDNAGTFRKSASASTTTVESLISFNNSGTVDIHSGILAMNGSYTSTAGALLNCVLAGITPGVGYGRLQVAGSVTLAGNLSVALTNNFIPAANSTYTVLSAGSRSGSFANFFYPSNSADMVMSNTPSSVVVRALGPYFATTVLPEGVRNIGYTQQVTAVMNSNPVVYSVISGALPSGLNLSTSGLIGGIPTNFGNGVFTIQASDAAGVKIQQAFNLRVRNLPAEGLISWWRAENNALDSISTNHGVLTNGATHAAGKVGQAFSFDGVNDYVNVPDATNLRPSSITLEAWATFNGTQGPVLGRSLGAGIHNSFLIWQQNGNINGVIEDASQTGLVLSAPLAPVAGQWYHVALTFDDVTKQQVLYLNGVVVASGQSLRSIGYDNHPLVIGGDIDNGSVSFLLNGGVDEAAIYNRALSTNEIAAIFLAGSAGKPANAPFFVTSPLLPDAAQMIGYTQQVSVVLGTSPITFSTPSGGLPPGLNLSTNGTISGIPLVAGTNAFILRATDALGAFSDQLTTLRVIAPVPAPSGLISWWRGEGNALDSVGTNHGTTSNGVSYIEGKVGRAFGFDGINDFVWVPDATNLRPTSITLEAWAKFNGAQGPVLGRSWGSGIHNSYVIWQLSGNINGTIGDTNQAADILTLPFAPASGQWYHVAFTFDDVTKQQALYLGGALVASGQSFRTIGYDNHPLVLGGDIDNGIVSFLLNGGVDEAAIYNRALTAGEIASIYNAGIAGKTISTLLTPYEQWKQTYLGDAHAPDDGDPDGDGFTNLAEYTADTNPTNAASHLRIIGVQFVPGGIAFQWQGGTQATQYLQCSFGLDASWTDIFTNLPPTASPSAFTNAVPANATQFYRLRAQR